jgi:ABC-type nitrate/sulfonate/bicarbonate transport system ATPase subunit
MEALQMEYTELAVKRKSLYVEYRQTKKKMLEWQTVQSNVERMLRQSEKARENQRVDYIER